MPLKFFLIVRPQQISLRNEEYELESPFYHLDIGSQRV